MSRFNFVIGLILVLFSIKSYAFSVEFEELTLKNEKVSLEAEGFSFESGYLKNLSIKVDDEKESYSDLDFDKIFRKDNKLYSISNKTKSFLVAGLYKSRESVFFDYPQNIRVKLKNKIIQDIFNNKVADITKEYDLNNISGTIKNFTFEDEGLTTKAKKANYSIKDGLYKIDIFDAKFMIDFKDNKTQEEDSDYFEFEKMSFTIKDNEMTFDLVAPKDSLNNDSASGRLEFLTTFGLHSIIVSGEIAIDKKQSLNMIYNSEFDDIDELLKFMDKEEATEYIVKERFKAVEEFDFGIAEKLIKKDDKPTVNFSIKNKYRLNLYDFLIGFMTDNPVIYLRQNVEVIH